MFIISWRRYPFRILREICLQYLKTANLLKCLQYYFQCWLLINHRLLTDPALNDGNTYDVERRNVVIASLRFLQINAAIRTAVWFLLIVWPLDQHWRYVMQDQMLFGEQKLNYIYFVIGR